MQWSSCCGAAGWAASLQLQDTGSIPRLARWVKGSGVAWEFHMLRGCPQKKNERERKKRCPQGLWQAGEWEWYKVLFRCKERSRSAFPGRGELVKSLRRRASGLSWERCICQKCCKGRNPPSTEAQGGLRGREEPGKAFEGS